MSQTDIAHGTHAGVAIAWDDRASHFDCKQIARSFRIDLLRLSATGKASLWSMVLFPLLFCAVAMFFDDGLLSSGLGGGAVGMCGMFAMAAGIMIFANEESTGNACMNGVIPVSRFNQVAARYALTFVSAAVMSLEAVICLLMVSHGGTLFSQLRLLRIIGIGVGILLFSLLVEGACLPIVYRFPTTKAMGYLVVFVFVVFAVFIVAVKLLPEHAIGRALDWVMSAKVGSIPSAVLVGAVLAVAVYIASFFIAERIYASKEL